MSSRQGALTAELRAGDTLGDQGGHTLKKGPPGTHGIPERPWINGIKRQVYFGAKHVAVHEVFLYYVFSMNLLRYPHNYPDDQSQGTRGVYDPTS